MATSIDETENEVSRVTLSRPVGVRLKTDVKERFYRLSRKHGGPSEVLRVLIHAYIENRITVQPKEELK